MSKALKPLTKDDGMCYNAVTKLILCKKTQIFIQIYDNYRKKGVRQIKAKFQVQISQSVKTL